MSIQAIRQYRIDLDRIVKYGGTAKETAIRSAFCNLLNEYARQRGRMMVAEISIKTRAAIFRRRDESQGYILNGNAVIDTKTVVINTDSQGSLRKPQTLRWASRGSCKRGATCFTMSSS